MNQFIWYVKSYITKKKQKNWIEVSTWCINVVISLKGRIWVPWGRIFPLSDCTEVSISRVSDSWLACRINWLWKCGTADNIDTILKSYCNILSYLDWSWAIIKPINRRVCVQCNSCQKKRIFIKIVHICSVIITLCKW